MCKMCGCIGSVLFLKMLCALYFNGFFSEDSRTVIILQLITWVVLGTGMSVIQYTPRHVLLKIICKLSLKKSVKFGNTEVSRNQLLWAFFSGNLYPKRIRDHDLRKKEGLCTFESYPMVNLSMILWPTKPKSIKNCTDLSMSENNEIIKCRPLILESSNQNAPMKP
jgi:hypothetical protein